MDGRIGPEIRRAHDRIADHYGGYIHGHPPAFDSRIAELLDRTVNRYLGGYGPLRVLDVGCGNGHFLEFFMRRGARQVVGVDFSERMLTVARGRVPPLGQGDLVEGNALALPLRSMSFDLVNSWGMVQHADSPSVAVQEMGRVTRPGGIVILDLPQRGSSSYLSHILLGVPPTLWGSPWRLFGLLQFRRKMDTYRFFTPEDGRRLFEAAGLELLEMVPTKYLALQGPALTAIQAWPGLARYGPRAEAVAKKILPKPAGVLVIGRRPGGLK